MFAFLGGVLPVYFYRWRNNGSHEAFGSIHAFDDQ
jgi:hypothetical protein